MIVAVKEDPGGAGGDDYADVHVHVDVDDYDYD